MKVRAGAAVGLATGALLVGALSAGCAATVGDPEPEASASQTLGGPVLSARGNVLASVGRRSRWAPSRSHPATCA